jgi:Fe-S cluster assembly protein SufD
VRTLSDALSADASFVEAQLASLAGFERSPFTALNTAFATDGVVIRVARNAEIAEPIEIAWVATDAAAGALISPRMLIDVAAGARVTIIESFSGAAGAAYFTNAVSELRVGDGARVDVLKVQEESTAAYHVGTLQASQGRDSIFHSFSYATGARLSRTNVYTTMASTGAEARLNGLYLLDGEQHCDHQTFVHHAAEACASRELYKGILDGSSHGVFNGKVLVDAIAQKTDGKQTNHALLLSEHARVDTKPQLEIFADDVKCTHGATVGRLDDTALFYLKSRGINQNTARALLTYAFAAGVLETIDFAPLRESLERLAFARYHDPSGA